MRELTLQEIQQESLKVLVEIDGICKEHGWRYFLIYGTLIGAVRHRGFIPWDDDVDICMLRKDYDAFMSYMEKEYEGKLAVHNRLNTKSYSYGVTRISNDSFRYITKAPREKQFKLGCFVDVYVFDYCGNNLNKCYELESKCIHINKNYQAYINPTATLSKWKILGKFLRKIYITLKGIEYGGPAIYAEKSIERMVKCYSSDNDIYVDSVVWVPCKKPFKSSWFKDTVYLKFEGHDFPVPCGYDECLRHQYGDYMKFPPEEERVPHHSYSIVCE